MTKKDKVKEMLEQASLSFDVKGEKAQLVTPEQREAQLSIANWKATKKKPIDVPEFDIPKQLLFVLMKTDEYNGLIFYGEGGIGKTVLTLNTIKQKLTPSEWEYSNGYTTPLALFEFLYKNRKKKVVILDDVEGVFNNNLSMSILKGSLWDSDGERIVQYASKSDKAKDLPSAFVMKAKIIILCNVIPKKHDASTRAMITRTIPYEIRFSYAQKLDICNQFIDKDIHLKTKEKLYLKILLEQHTDEATRDFNFRTLKKAIAFMRYDKKKAVELFKSTTQIDLVKKVYLEAVKTYATVSDQVEYFKQNTGKSRRTFFRIKKQIGE